MVPFLQGRKTVCCLPQQCDILEERFTSHECASHRRKVLQTCCKANCVERSPSNVADLFGDDGALPLVSKDVPT